MQPGRDRIARAREAVSSAMRDGFEIAWRRPTALSWREVAVAALVLFVVNYALYWRMIGDGPLIADDWFWLARFKFSNDSLFQVFVASDFLHSSAYRPGHQALQHFMNAIADQSRSPRIALGIGIAALESTALFVLLRKLGMRTLPAALAGLTLAVMPSIDTTRLAFSAINETLAAVLYMAGVIAAITGLQSSRGRWGQVAWHAAALILYLAAIFTYESFLALVPLSVLLYIVATGSVRPALQRWPADLAATVVSGVAVTGTAEELRGADTSVGYILDRVEPVWNGLLKAFAYTLPGDSLLRGPLGVMALVIVTAGVSLAIERGGELRRPALIWLATAGLAILFTLAAAVVLLPGAEALVPTYAGVDNRLNVAPAIGEAVLIVALVALAAIGLAELLRRPAVAAPLAAGVLALNCGLLVHKERQNQEPWIEVHAWQQRIFDAVDTAIQPEPPPGSKVITFGHPLWIQGVPVFFDYDLGLALQLRHTQMGTESRPYLSNGACLKTGYSSGAYSTNPGLRNLVPYAEGIYFVNVPLKQATRITDRAQCERELKRLVPPLPAPPAPAPAA